MPNIWRVIRLIPEYRRRVAGVVLVGVLVGLIGTATPYVYKGVVDVVARMVAGKVGHEQALQAVSGLMAAFVLLRCGVVALNALQGRQADDLWIDMVGRLRQRVFDQMTRKSIDYFEKTRAGEIMDRFGTITGITMWLSNFAEGTLGNLLQSLFIVAVLMWMVPGIGLVMAAVLAINLGLSFFTMLKARLHRRGWQEQAERMSGLLAEMIGSIATVRSFGGEAAVKQRYDDAQAHWRVTRGALHKLEWRSSLALNVVNTAAIIVSFLLIARGALRGDHTPGDILLVLTLAQSLIGNIQPIARLFSQTGAIENSAERLMQLLDVESGIADAPDAVDLGELRRIEFERVSFRYPGTDTAALSEVSFRIDAGDQLALVGPSGSGKTTIVKLLMRFYDPGAGRILVNGRDLRGYRQASLRACMGVVLQDVALFNDSVGENIGFACAGAAPQDIEAAARAAHADAFIARLPHRYATLVGERGVKLSGGEKQRVAIARAILRKPQLVILDEATSALDSESEQAVQLGLQQLLSGRSSVVIAHRLSTVTTASQIIVLHQGRVVERGRHADLVGRSGGFYARLCALQHCGLLPDTLG